MFSLFLFFILCVPEIQGTDSLCWESKLVADLLSGYDKRIKPTAMPSKPINVTIGLALTQLINMDERNQQMTTTGFLIATWRDEMLHWDPSMYNGTNRIVLNGDQIWLPEVAVYNGISAINDISLASKFRVTVYFDGIVLWIPSVTLNTSCDMDLTNFPFDTQKCSIIITNWIYSAKLLQFLPDSDEVLLVAFQNSSDWFLDKTNVTQKIENFADIELAMIIFELSLRRVPSYWVTTILIPCLILITMSLLMFVMPTAGQEKISIGITVLLSYFFIILMISDIAPRSQKVPILMLYIVMTMLFSGISIMLTMVVMNLQLLPRESGVPQWAKVLFIQKIGGWLRVKHGLKLSHPFAVHPIVENGHSNDDNIASYNASSVPPIGHEIKFVSSSNSSIQKKYPIADDVKIDTGGSLQSLLKFYKAKARRKDKKRQMVEEWTALATVVDIILCIAFAVAIFGFTIYTVISLVTDNAQLVLI